MRVPCVMWTPGRIPAGGECDRLTTTLDLLPTLAALTHSKLPEDLKIDGVDISSLLADPMAPSPRKEFLYSSKSGQLEGIRQDQWKLLLRGNPRNQDGPPPSPYRLFDLSNDIGENHDLAAGHPELVAALRQRMMELDTEIGENARPCWKK